MPWSLEARSALRQDARPCKTPDGTERPLVYGDL